MEALDTRRHSGISSIVNRESVDRINTGPAYSSAHKMAATALVSPTSIYSTNNSPPYCAPGWPAPSTYAVSGLISPPESRRMSDNRTEPPPPVQTAPHQQQRQSLPSLQEALSTGGKSNPYTSPPSAPLHSSQHYSQNHAQTIPRTYPPEHTPYQPQSAPQPRHGSPPHPVHPQPTPFGRSDPIPVSFSESSRHSSLSSLQTAPGPSTTQYTPRFESSRHEPDPRAPTGGYTYNPSPPQPASYSFGPGSQIPPRQLPAYDEQPYTTQEGREQVERWKGVKEDDAPAFRVGLKRHLDVWDFENNLAQINHSSSALRDWSRHYNTIAQEQQRQVGVMPDRMPSLESCKEMLEHSEKIALSVRRMQDTILEQKHAMADQRMRDQGVKTIGEYDDDVSIYGDERQSQGFGGSEGKKRRGRAAPPGRCHSCNRAETPEWRRGPDGARTLCNACGLHYAKLTRKNTLKQSQSSNAGSPLRPKSMDGQSSPRR